MAEKPVVGVVRGDMVRLAGSAAPYQRVLGVRHDTLRTLLWFEDPAHPGEPSGPPTSIAHSGTVDTE
jgi:hypothetical protein